MRINHKSRSKILDLEALYGGEWAEMRVSKYGLSVPGWRSALPPGELRSMFYRCQHVAALESRVALLERDCAAAQARAEAAEEKAAQLRRLVVAESRLGLALLAITSPA